MPVRSSIDTLPEEVRRELERRLVGSGFGGYVALAEWLQSLGFQISKSAVHRWGSQFEERLQALRVANEQARAIAEAASSDGDNNFSEALLRLTQEKAFQVLLNLQVDGEDFDAKSFNRLAGAVANLGRANVYVARYRDEVRQKVEERLKALEGEAGTAGGKLDPETLRRVREEIYGIV